MMEEVGATPPLRRKRKNAGASAPTGSASETTVGLIDRTAWRRDAEAQDVTSKLGQRVREYREARGISLNEASEATGIPGATLSRIETNKMAPTFSLFLKLMRGLKLTWGELMTPGSVHPRDRAASIAHPEDGKSVRIHKIAYTSPHMGSPLLNTLAPVTIESTARVLADVGGLVGHKGVEHCYVLAGTLVLHLADRPPQQLGPGSSVLFDAEIPHAYLTKGRGSVKLLITVTRDPMMPLEDATILGQRGATPGA